ncbi:MAG: DUF3524 domain-containing protein [Actinobacteria bacterium]|nr:DUF3524 domain-containing protein [Actinomycetota bacterium]
MTLRVLLVEPFHGGSHAAWAGGLAQHSRHEVVTVSLPGSFWRWRMRGASVSLATATVDLLAGQRRPDVVLASGMFDLSAWLGLTRRILGDPPIVLYLHENQLGYPLSPNQKADDEFPLANWRSMFAADEVWCNSRFQLEELLDNMPALLDRSPDESHAHMLEEVAGRCSVVPVGVEMADLPGSGERGDPSVATPLVLWNHRWEHDKNPKAVFGSLVKLAEEGVAFDVAIVGENVRVDPREMDEARQALGGRVVQFGHMPRSGYVALLGRADVVVSAAHHEYFGVSVVEAVAAGAVPVLPDGLSYPEVVPPPWHPSALYPEGGLTTRLREVLTDLQAWRARCEGLSGEMRRFDWREVVGTYDDRLEALGEGYGRTP